DAAHHCRNFTARDNDVLAEFVWSCAAEGGRDRTPGQPERVALGGAGGHPSLSRVARATALGDALEVALNGLLVIAVLLEQQEGFGVARQSDLQEVFHEVQAR